MNWIEAILQMQIQQRRIHFMTSTYYLEKEIQSIQRKNRALHLFLHSEVNSRH